MFHEWESAKARREYILEILATLGARCKIQRVDIGDAGLIIFPATACQHALGRELAGLGLARCGSNNGAVVSSAKSLGNDLE